MLGRTFGRMDWWRIKGEHTPQEWKLQRAMFIADPWGEVRDDLRTAIQTRRIVGTSGVPSKCEGEDFEYLRFYLKHNKSEPEYVSPEQLAALMKDRYR